MLQLLQHREIMSMMREEAVRMAETQSETSWAVVCQAREELDNLEEQLREEGRELLAEDGRVESREQVMCYRAEVSQANDPQGQQIQEQEVLQTRTIPMDEVRRELQTWVEPFRKEVENLTSGPVTRLTAQEFQALKDQQVDMQVIPMKMVATRKPSKLKGRIVACGNLAEEYAHDDISAGCACAIAVRTAVHIAANMGYDLGSIDVTGAFLQAPRRGCGRLTICQPPKLLQTMGLVQAGEVWKVDCALYGFAESPSDWGRYRDSCLRKVEWTHEEDRYQLIETPEKHVWKIVRNSSDTCGNLCVYVDDILAGAKREVLERLFQTLKETCMGVLSRGVCHYGEGHEVLRLRHPSKSGWGL